MVATQNPLATNVALDVLRQGGQAIDAGIAAAFALAVVEPYNSGLGGGGFALYFDPALPAPVFLDFRERAPLEATPQAYMFDGKAQPQWLQNGWKAAAVPGEVAGLFALHERFGRDSIKKLLAPAQRLARDGFPVDMILARRLRENAERFRADAQARQTFLNASGEPLNVGALLVQTQLASTLQALAKKGPEAFYGERAAQRWSAASQAQGGLFRPQDFRRYKPQWREPLHGSYREFEILSAPPPSSGGGVLLEALAVAEQFNLTKTGAGSAESLHVMAQALGFAFYDRVQFYGDPDFVRIPLPHLLSSTLANRRARRVSQQRALSAAELARDDRADRQTTHLVVVDEGGRALSMTLTLNTSFGAGVMLPGTGIVLNNQMDDFSLPDVANTYGLLGGQNNAIAPGKTPLSSMAPTMVLKNGRPVLVLGSPGGPRIISSVFNAIINWTDFQMNVRDAVQAPRLHYQWQPDLLYLEDNGFAPEVMQALRRKGHHLEIQPAWSNVQAIAITPATSDGERLLQGAADDRGQGRVEGF